MVLFGRVLPIGGNAQLSSGEGCKEDSDRGSEEVRYMLLCYKEKGRKRKKKEEKEEATGVKNK